MLLLSPEDREGAEIDLILVCSGLLEFDGAALPAESSFAHTAPTEEHLDRSFPHPRSSFHGGFVISEGLAGHLRVVFSEALEKQIIVSQPVKFFLWWLKSKTSVSTDERSPELLSHRVRLSSTYFRQDNEHFRELSH